MDRLQRARRLQADQERQQPPRSRTQIDAPTLLIAGGLLENEKLEWPNRFFGDDMPLGRVLRASSDVISFARSTPTIRGPALVTCHAVGADAAASIPSSSHLRGLVCADNRKHQTTHPAPKGRARACRTLMR